MRSGIVLRERSGTGNQKLAFRARGSSQKTPTEMGFGNTRPTPVDSWLAIATTSIVGLQQRRTTDMTAIRRFISAGRELA